MICNVESLHNQHAIINERGENKMAIKQFMISASTVLLFASLLSGCGNKAAEPSIIPLAEENQVNQTATAATTKNPVEHAVQNPKPEKEKSPAEISSDDQKDQDGDQSQTPADENETDLGNKEKSDFDVVAAYNPNKPTLMGLTIHQTLDEVIESFGVPSEEYVMEDENDPITVYDYSDFLIGLDQNNEIKFIDVYSLQINPGLNGLRLGDTVQHAVSALGSPDSNTEYVLNYTSQNVILKLDINPDTQTIHSIKLFENN
jgi:hypothetical protein